MKTKEKIKHTARSLFNKKGFKNVTLREVAKVLDISYGNVTYHYKTKNQLILRLYEDMLIETQQIFLEFDRSDLLQSILHAPKITFEISLKYLFFYVDFVEIKRSYPVIRERLETDAHTRKTGYMHILKQLQSQGLLRKELSTNDLDYLMDLSGAMRTFFFIQLDPKDYQNEDLNQMYVSYVNKLIYPYLTTEGIEKYNLYLA